MAVQLTAVMILAIFYGCYFSKMLAQRRKGIQTDQMGKGKTGEARTIELTMKVTTLLVPLVELMSIYPEYKRAAWMGQIPGDRAGAFGRRGVCDFGPDNERQLARRRLRNRADGACYRRDLSAEQESCLSWF